jgi:hypothetical protein
MEENRSSMKLHPELKKMMYSTLSEMPEHANPVIDEEGA